MTYPSSHTAYRSQAVQTAGPAQLVLMLYDGALAALVRARSASEQPGSVEAVNRELQKAQAIVSELQVTLDHEKGGVVAAGLASLYAWCVELLVEANLRKDLSRLGEVESILRDLRDAWSEACCSPAPAAVG